MSYIMTQIIGILAIPFELGRWYGKDLVNYIDLRSDSYSNTDLKFLTFS